jgi:hypothetical protein
MARTALHWLGSSLVGVAAGGAATWFGIDPYLAGPLGFCTAGCVLLLLRVYREYPDRMTGDTWADKRWTGLSFGVINGAALLAMWASVTDENRLALGILVILVGLLGYTAGSLAEMERDRTRQERAGGDPVPADD